MKNSEMKTKKKNNKLKQKWSENSVKELRGHCVKYPTTMLIKSKWLVFSSNNFHKQNISEKEFRRYCCSLVFGRFSFFIENFLFSREGNVELFPFLIAYIRIMLSALMALNRVIYIRKWKKRREKNRTEREKTMSAKRSDFIKWPVKN